MNVEIKNNMVQILFDELEEIFCKYEELMDTEVRESLHITLNYFFVWGGKHTKFPVSYGMFSLDGDRAVARAVANFIMSADACPQISNVPFGQARLDLLQNWDIKTSGGYQYDEFIGHSDEPIPPMPLPRYLFNEGDYEE